MYKLGCGYDEEYVNHVVVLLNQNGSPSKGPLFSLFCLSFSSCSILINIPFRSLPSLLAFHLSHTSPSVSSPIIFSTFHVDFPKDGEDRENKTTKNPPFPPQEETNVGT